MFVVVPDDAMDIRGLKENQVVRLTMSMVLSSVRGGVVIPVVKEAGVDIMDHKNMTRFDYKQKEQIELKVELSSSDQ